MMAMLCGFWDMPASVATGERGVDESTTQDGRTRSSCQDARLVASEEQSPGVFVNIYMFAWPSLAVSLSVTPRGNLKDPGVSSVMQGPAETWRARARAREKSGQVFIRLRLVSGSSLQYVIAGSFLKPNGPRAKIERTREKKFRTATKRKAPENQNERERERQKHTNWEKASRLEFSFLVFFSFASRQSSVRPSRVSPAKRGVVLVFIDCD